MQLLVESLAKPARCETHPRRHCAGRDKIAKFLLLLDHRNSPGARSKVLTLDDDFRARVRWLLEPKRVEGFQLTRQTYGAGGRELAMGAEQRVRPGSNCFADILYEFDGAGNVVQRRLMRIENSVRSSRVEFYRCKPLRNVLCFSCKEMTFGISTCSRTPLSHRR